MTTKYSEIEKIKFEYDQLTEEFTAELDDKTIMSIMGGNRGKWAQLFNAKQAINKAMLEAQESEPAFYVSKRSYDMAMTSASGIGVKGISREKLLPDDVACYTHPPAQESEPVAMKCEAVAQDGRTAPMLWFKTYSQIPEGTKLYTHPPADKDAELKALKCPNCNDVGYYAVPMQHQFELEQCEFCYTEPHSIFNLKRAIDEAMKG